MLIDWFTVGAQALNFLVLVWLLRHFLYQPILRAIDAREKTIAAKLADAAAKETDAQQQRDNFQRKNEQFDQLRASLLSKASEEASAERQRLLDEARKAAEALSAKRREALADDARNLGKAISRRTQDEVFSIARKALADLADASLEARMCDVFIQRLQRMPEEAKTAFAEALRTSAGPVLLRSALDLPAAQHKTIQKAINETFSTEIEVHFETAPDLIGGVELRANGQKVEWSIAGYLASLEQSVGELLEEKSQPETKPQ